MESAHLTNISSVIQWHPVVNLRVVLILQLEASETQVKKLCPRSHSRDMNFRLVPWAYLLKYQKVHTITETSLSLSIF